MNTSSTPVTVAETASGQVEYADAGDGPPILYFHGSGITCSGMMPIESALVDDGFRLIMPNRPGYGQTPLAPNESILSGTRVAAALLDELGLEKIAVMGSSGGGAFALEFALHYHHRCSSVTLMCPQLHRWTSKKWLPRPSWWTLPFLKRRWLRRLLMKGYRSQFSRIKAKKFLKLEAGARIADVVDDPHAMHLAEVSIAAMKVGVTQPGFENDMRAFAEEDIFSPQLRLSPPTLILHDPEDPLVPVNHIDWLMERAPECTRMDLTCGGHLIWAGRDRQRMHETRVEFVQSHA